MRLRGFPVAIPVGSARLTDLAIHALGNLGFEGRERRIGGRVRSAKRPVPGEAVIVRVELLDDLPDVGAAVPVCKNVVVAKSDGLADRALLYEARSLDAAAGLAF